MNSDAELSAEQQRIRELHYAEDWGMVFELLTLPRMAGRVWAALAIAPEAYLASDDLEDRLEASAGSVNTALRFLLRQGSLERVRVPGERKHFYRLRTGSVQALLNRRMAVMTELKKLAARGMEEFAERPRVREALEEVHDFYAFFEDRMPGLVEEFLELQRSRTEEDR
jgi:DNA-binding transcriptional regulator GbsR (MarR family)